MLGLEQGPASRGLRRHLGRARVEYRVLRKENSQGQMTPNGPHRCRHYGTGANVVAPVPSYTLDKINGTGA